MSGFLRSWRWIKPVQKIEAAHQALRTYRQRPQSVVAAFLLSIVFDFALMYFNFLDALAIGHRVELKYFFVFIPIISMVSMLPVSLYGLGLREYSFVLLFGQTGVSRESALLIAILALIVPAIASLPGGLVYLLVSRRHPPGAGEASLPAQSGDDKLPSACEPPAH